MIVKFLVLITVISQVNSQFYQVTLPCLQGGMSKSNPTFAVSPTFLQAQKLPQQVLANSNVIVSNQPCICPLEYTITSLTSLPQSMPVPIATPAPTPCCPPSPIPYKAEFIVPNCKSEVCLPEVEPVFDFSLGCLDPILKCYGTINEIPTPDILCCGSINPFLPAASPVSPVLPPCSPILPPALPSECSCHFLKKISIPPPFI